MTGVGCLHFSQHTKSLTHQLSTQQVAPQVFLPSAFEDDYDQPPAQTTLHLIMISNCMAARLNPAGIITPSDRHSMPTANLITRGSATPIPSSPRALPNLSIDKHQTQIILITNFHPRNEVTRRIELIFCTPQPRRRNAVASCGSPGLHHESFRLALHGSHASQSRTSQNPSQ